MKLTLEVYSTSAGDAGGAPSFGVRIRDRRALEAGALYDPLDVNFLVDGEFLPAPETIAVSIYRPSEDGEDTLVATTAGSVFAPVPGHSMMRRGVLATATPGFDSWYEETKCPDGDHTYSVPVFTVLEVRWSCGAEDCVARAEAAPAILTPIGVRAVKGLDGTDGEDGKAPEVDVADHGDGTYTMTVTSPDGTVQTVDWRDGRDGDGVNFPIPVSPADATRDDQYADALAVQGLLESLRKDLSGLEVRLDVIDSLTGVELLEGIQESLAGKVDSAAGYGLVSERDIEVLEDFVDTFGEFGDLAGLDKITFNELGTDLADRIKALEAAVESFPSSGGGTLDPGYVKFLDAVVASGDDPAQRILAAVNLVLAESNDAGMGIWKAVNANAKGLAELEAKVGSGGSSSIPAELEAMIRNSVQKDALGRGFSSNDFTQDYIDRINNSVQKEPGKGLSTVDFTMERAERLDALFHSSPTLNPPVKPDESAKKGQPADAKDTYEALKGLSFTEAPDSHGSEWQVELVGTPGGVWTFTARPSLEWRTSTATGVPAWYVTPFTVELSSSDVPVPDSTLEGAYLLPGAYHNDSISYPHAYDRNLDDVDCECFLSGVGTTAGTYVRIPIQVRFHRELYIYKGDPYVTKTYVDSKVADIEIPEGGTDDYDGLSNKPSINGTELTGSMTAADLGLSTVEGDADGEWGPTVAKQAANSYWANAAGYAETAADAASAGHATTADRAHALVDTYGDLVSSADVLKQLNAKRDKTDNVAAKDETMFSDWKFRCDVPEIQAALDANPPAPNFLDLNWRFEGEFTAPPPEVDGYMIYEVAAEGGPDATVLTANMYQSVATEDLIQVTATRTKTFTTKEGEPYVTPAGVKALTASEFNKLAPETSEGKVTLKPVDGKANWVEETVAVEAVAGGLKSFSLNMSDVYIDLYDTREGYWDGDGPVREFNCHAILTSGEGQGARVEVFIDDMGGEGNPDDMSWGYRVYVDKPIELADDDTGETIAYLRPRGYDSDGRSTSYLRMYTESFDPDGEFAETVDGAIDVYIPKDDPLRRFDLDFVDSSCNELYLNPDFDGLYADAHLIREFDRVPAKSMSVEIPTKPGSSEVRRLSLSVCTDTESHKAVSWEGADEIIEAFPGASKLVPGEVVWDVKEVAPGKMLVNRVPGAAGGAVTLTSESGGNYKLTINNSGELEVKES